MIYRYAGGRFVQMNVPPIVSEGTIGTDGNSLTYPNVSSCTTVTVLLSDNTLVGVHFDKLSTVFDVYAMLQKMAGLAGTRATLALAVVGALKTVMGGFMTKADFAYPRLFRTFAEAFGHNGQVLTYDQDREKHYRIHAVGGGNLLAWSKNVGTRLMSGMQISENYQNETSVPWEILPMTPVTP